MKKLVTFALALSVFGGAIAAVAATNNQLKGSDTLEPMTRFILNSCSGTAPLVYIGGGSSGGEQALLDGTQEVAPMSRLLDKARTCKAATPATSESRLVGLDGIAVVGDNDNAQCASSGVGFVGDCLPVTDQNGVAGVSASECPGCDAGNAQYCFNSEYDALRVLFAGMHKTGGNNIANQNCNSDVRHSLANSWDALFEGACASGECSQVKHAFRRDDLSGTTDTFLGLLGLPAIGVKPFCNGAFSEDLDPIRRTCDPSDTVCSVNGTSGLVLPVFVPDLTLADEPTAYPQTSCQTGKFSLAEAQSTTLVGGGVRFDCPERGNFSIAGFCLAPQSSTNSFSCLSGKANPNVFFGNLSDDARLFNRWVRKADGKLLKDGAGRPEINAYYRVRGLTCKEGNSTRNIGCLAGEYACSVGFAGREADDAFASTKALNVKGIALSEASVRRFLTVPLPADTYPLARGLYFNSMKGFENTVNVNEQALEACYDDQAAVDAAVVDSGFYTLGTAPVCKDFDERSCNTLVCDSNSDCGASGLCVGGNPATTSVKEGTCTQACDDNSDCTQAGRTCDLVAGKCVYTANTNACAL